MKEKGQEVPVEKRNFSGRYGKGQIGTIPGRGAETFRVATVGLSNNFMKSVCIEYGHTGDGTAFLVGVLPTVAPKGTKLVAFPEMFDGVPVLYKEVGQPVAFTDSPTNELQAAI